MRYPISETNMEREETQRNIFGRRMTKDLWEYVALIPGLSRCFTVPLPHIGLAEKPRESHGSIKHNSGVLTTK